MSDDSQRLSFRPKTSEIPLTPGVYRFYDANGRILYVGKAKNLRNRLVNYFGPLESLHERTKLMVTTAADVDWVVVSTEFEALQLEYTWIKEFDPPFNVQFRDDKSYPYLAVSLGFEFPRAYITRQYKKSSKVRFFGPYTKGLALRQTLDIMLKAFPVRSCSDGVFRRAKQSDRPCLLGDIGKCSAPCVGRVTAQEHRKIATDFVEFMNGNDATYIQHMREKMLEASEKMQYELAARYRDAGEGLEEISRSSAVVLSDRIDADFFGLEHDDLAAGVHQFIVRSGRIRGVRSWVVDKEVDMGASELIEAAIRTAYQDGHMPAPLILVPDLPGDVEGVQQWLSSQRNGLKARVAVPKRGEKLALLETSYANAKNGLALYKTRRINDFATRSKALVHIGEELGMKQAPLRIECFDVSHLSGTNVVASMVVFEDGIPKKEHYRRFILRETTGDTDSIYQVVRRRLRAMKDPERKGFAYHPDLFLIDGAQAQVAAAERALSEAGVTTIFVAGIAKRLEELWCTDSEFPIIFSRNSDALFLLQRIRDEAHRFAITHQRQRRKKDLKTSLEDIPGLGSKRAKALLVHFGSLEQMRQADVEQLMQVPGMGKVLATIVREHLLQDGNIES